MKDLTSDDKGIAADIHNLNELMHLIHDAAFTAREDGQKALRKNDDPTYWAAQGRAISYDHIGGLIRELLRKQRTLNLAIAKVLDGFDRAVFVRNTGNDAQDDWAIRQAPYIQALAILQQHLDLLKGIEKL